MNGLHVIQYPSGRFGFVGKVPQELAHRGHPDDLEIARICGPGLARKFAARNSRVFESLSWETKEAAIQAAADLGYTVTA